MIEISSVYKVIFILVCGSVFGYSVIFSLVTLDSCVSLEFFLVIWRVNVLFIVVFFKLV